MLRDICSDRPRVTRKSPEPESHNRTHKGHVILISLCKPRLYAQIWEHNALYIDFCCGEDEAKCWGRGGTRFEQ